MTALERLLVVQVHDLTAEQLRHRRAALPERAALAEASGRLRRLEAARAEVEAERADVERSQQQLDDQVGQLTARIDLDTARLYSGEISGTKELQVLQGEIDGLQQRRSEIEDQALELLVALDPFEERLAVLTQQREEIEAEFAGHQARLAEQEDEIDRELAAIDGQRVEQAATIPDDLLREYESLRDRLSGPGVARLQGSACTGCHLELSAVDVDRIRHEPPDAVVHCSECGCILVQ